MDPLAILAMGSLIVIWRLFQVKKETWLNTLSIFKAISFLAAIVIGLPLMFYLIVSIVGWGVGLLPHSVLIVIGVVWVIPMILKDIGKEIGKGIAESEKKE